MYQTAQQIERFPSLTVFICILKEKKELSVYTAARYKEGTHQSCFQGVSCLNFGGCTLKISLSNSHLYPRCLSLASLIFDPQQKNRIHRQCQRSTGLADRVLEVGVGMEFGGWLVYWRAI